MARLRPYILANLAKLVHLPAGSADAVDQLRQQLDAIGIETSDKRAVSLATRLVRLAEKLYGETGGDPEYVKRARLNHALVLLCSHLESRAANEVAKQLAGSPQRATRRSVRSM
jgi:hypothetical protein